MAMAPGSVGSVEVATIRSATSRTAPAALKAATMASTVLRQARSVVMASVPTALGLARPLGPTTPLNAAANGARPLGTAATTVAVAVPTGLRVGLAAPTPVRRTAAAQIPAMEVTGIPVAPVEATVPTTKVKTRFRSRTTRSIPEARRPVALVITVPYVAVVAPSPWSTAALRSRLPGPSAVLIPGP